MTDGITPIDQALMPAAVRNGGQQRKEEYQAALSFERVLVGQLTDQLAKSFGALGDDDKSGSAATQQMKQMLPETLADSLMASGGIGLASQLDQMWHQGERTTSTSVSANQAAPSGDASGVTLPADDAASAEA